MLKILPAGVEIFRANIVYVKTPELPSSNRIGRFGMGMSQNTEEAGKKEERRKDANGKSPLYWFPNQRKRCLERIAGEKRYSRCLPGGSARTSCAPRKKFPGILRAGVNPGITDTRTQLHHPSSSFLSKAFGRIEITSFKIRSKFSFTSSCVTAANIGSSSSLSENCLKVTSNKGLFV